MEAKDIVNIGLEHIHPHPDNPRKDLGDLTELAESIKKNGILQNLTVIPKEGEPGEYIAIIGHRRSAAAKLAVNFIQTSGNAWKVTAWTRSHLRR